MQRRAAVILSQVLLLLALGAAQTSEEPEWSTESASTPIDIQENDVFPLDTRDENENELLENEDIVPEKDPPKDHSAFLESKKPISKGVALLRESRIAAPRSRFPSGVIPMAPPYGYNRFYPGYSPSNYYYPQFQPSNYMPNTYYPGYQSSYPSGYPSGMPSGYPPNYYPSNPTYQPSYYPGSPVQYPMSGPYDYYPGGVNEYARKHTID